MIEYYSGDVFQTKRNVIAHGVNCKGVFGAGFAKQVATKYPIVKNGYMRKFNERGWKPGDIQYIPTDHKWENPHDSKLVIVNMATQDGYGSKGVYIDYGALYQCFSKLFYYCEEHGIEGCAMPQVGCGLAGGDWLEVEHILKQCLGTRELTVEVYIYGNKKGKKVN